MRYSEVVSVFALIIMSSTMLYAQSQPTISYTALSDAARKSGQLALYDDSAVKTGSLELDEYILDFTVPETARAYDVIPITYTLRQPAGERRAAVEAVAFEDREKAGDRPLYDLAIPGDLSVNVEYLGSISGDFDHEAYIPLTPDPNTPVSPFPPYKRDEMVRSSTIRSSEIIWFKFRITNTGNTILDPEGFGASFAEPRITRLDENGDEVWSAGTLNAYERHLEYIYPGESFEQWINFYTPRLGGRMCRGLTEGDYRISYRMVYRYHREYHWGVNIWSGVEFARLDLPIKVRSEAAQTPVEAEFRITDEGEKMPGYVEYFEEFMTAFRIHPPLDQSPGVSHEPSVLYLQVATWTEDVVVKLILTDPQEIAVARIPIDISLDTLEVTYNPDNVMVVDNEPAFIAMAMPGMRTGFQLGPFPEEHMREEIEEMKALGVNVISNTAGGWWLAELTGRTGVEIHSACYKYYYDVLVRQANMKVLGWSLYPPSSTFWYDNAAPLLGREVEYSTAGFGYSGHAVTVDMGDRVVPEVIAAWAIYNHQRWGDTWFKTKDGRVPIEMEDSWGWMRDDVNLRHHVGPLALESFREWLREKYVSIDAVNAAWGSDYASFDEIDPEEDQGEEGLNLPHRPVYNKKDHVFHDWTPAVEDWDIFRTHLRMDILRRANELIQERIPGGEIAVRTEGANLVIKGDGESDNMHWRHVYYSQRRNAMVFDVVKETDVLHFYSDYTTLPYSTQDWRQAMREMVAAGVIPMFLPQFDHMRDILLNPHYGREYQMHYNLDEPSKGMMIHRLMAAYPWWKATYEEGGAPGIIWSDYQCDGFATETQKRELRLLRDHFDRMKRE